jgi:hypothetical protein
MSSWVAFDNGRSIGKVGAEGGVILRDEKHPLGGRITLRRGKSHITVSCKINGWMDPTAFFKSILEAERGYTIMKRSLATVIELSASARRGDVTVWESISAFVAKFP